MIPDFTEQGILPPGIHQATLDDVRSRLGWGRKREDLIKGLEMALQLVGNCGVERVYLDGSFVTDKDRPGDIDGCYDVPPGADLTKAFPIWPLNQDTRRLSKSMFGVELFPANFSATTSGEPYISFFQKDRQGRQKGIVLVELGGEA